MIGLGKSGVAAARLLTETGARVSVTEKRPRSAVAGWVRELPRGVSCETGSHRFLGRPWDLVVTSPGVPSEVWRDSLRRGVPVWGELELGCRVLGLAGRWPRRSAAVTGTNGKTTTTALLGEIFRAAGEPTVVAGNIGTPLCEAASRVRHDTVLVLEVSSYQLEAAPSFLPAAGTVLNVTPDHLGRHGTMARYAEAKFRMFQNQGPDQAALLNADDPWCRRLGGGVPGRVFWFSGRALRGPGVFWNGRRLVCSLPGASGSWPAPRHLLGRHNIENALAAAGCARLLGADAGAVGRALDGFKGVEHRLEHARLWRGVRWVNDSKATNVDSTAVALRALEGPLRVILGGQHKGAPYTPLRALLKRKAREVLLIGEAAGLIERDLRGAVPLVRCETLDRAVESAARNAVAGDTVLLSPACASFDQFDNFEHRGRRFKELVNRLP